MTASAPAAAWFTRMYHEVRRNRHLVLHGNIDDLVLWGDEYRPLAAVLPEFLTVAGYAVTTRYDLIDGLAFHDAASRSFILSRLDTAPAPPPPEPPSPDDSGRTRQLSAAERQLRTQARSSTNPAIRTPTDLLVATRSLLLQTERSCAVVIDQADLIFARGIAMDDHYQANLACLRKMITEAGYTRTRDGMPLRNIVILLANQLNVIPEWVFRNNPNVSTLDVPRPNTMERTDFLRRDLPRYWGSNELSREQLDRAATTLSNLCEGMTLLDIGSLGSTSQLTRIDANSPRRLVMRHRFGLQSDPWEQLDRQKILGAEKRIADRVIGQDVAVRAVADVLINARVGLDFVSGPDAPATRPKGVFFFVGPTGVGKTELAKAIAELVFDDESALRRFDMSEYNQDHSSERLTGAPPGYVGHENGGTLTNWILERPFSVVLFDEIEKAHPRIFDKFLQIIDDGRLTDGQGRTAHFSQSIVIFTSNLGSDTLDGVGGSATEPPEYEEIREHFEAAVTQYLSEQLGRPELLGRLGGGIVVFDVLRQEVINRIVAKFLTQLGNSATARGYELEFDQPAIQAAVSEHLAREGARLGAREIHSPLLEQWVRRPLNRWIIENEPAPGTRIRVSAGADSPPFTVGLVDPQPGSAAPDAPTSPG
ncbi:AAA family ATPase [Nocardia sp. NPDC059240]|uniref:AAA family ATPase n=1 Tax=Nocardia sp. NPDC059240 TaxID=3346786 RepID=UPI0036BF778D